MEHSNLHERRRHPRYPTASLPVRVRKKGRFATLDGMAADFNRHGMGLIIDQPLPKDSVVFLTIADGCTRIKNVRGVVHNCCATPAGYRCGVQFRTDSPQQFDGGTVSQQLLMLESRLVNDLPSQWTHRLSG